MANLLSNECLFDMELDTEPKILDTPFIFDNITNELEEYLLEEQGESDAEDGLFSIVESVTSKLQEDYDELIGNNTDKKRFIKSLTRVFALLLNTKVDTVDKIKKKQNCRQNDTKNMARTKVTPKRRPRTSTVSPWLMNRHQNRTLRLPEQKIVNITKNGNVIKTIRVRTGSKYFTDRWARQF